jgi:hypothetical protein
MKQQQYTKETYFYFIYQTSPRPSGPNLSEEAADYADAKVRAAVAQDNVQEKNGRTRKKPSSDTGFREYIQGVCKVLRGHI